MSEQIEIVGEVVDAGVHRSDQAAVALSVDHIGRSGVVNRVVGLGVHSTSKVPFSNLDTVNLW